MTPSVSSVCGSTHLRDKTWLRVSQTHLARGWKGSRDLERTAADQSRFFPVKSKAWNEKESARKRQVCVYMLVLQVCELWKGWFFSHKTGRSRQSWEMSAERVTKVKNLFVSHWWRKNVTPKLASVSIRVFFAVAVRKRGWKMTDLSIQSRGMIAKCVSVRAVVLHRELAHKGPANQWGLTCAKRIRSSAVTYLSSSRCQWRLYLLIPLLLILMSYQHLDEMPINIMVSRGFKCWFISICLHVLSAPLPQLLSILTSFATCTLERHCLRM